MELIDKSVVVAEIERRKRKLLDHIICESDKEWVVRTAHQLNRIIMFLDTLKVKEVDLEKEYKDFVEEDPIYNKLVNGIVGKAIAKHFFELGMHVSNKAQKGK